MDGSRSRVAISADVLPAARVVSVTRDFPAGGQTVKAVDDVSLVIPRGQLLAIVGRSGSGKSTLLNLLAGIDVPTSGEVWIGDRELSRLRDDDLTVLRRDRLGIVYQFFNLLPTLSVRENVALPALLGGSKRQRALSRADRLLSDVGLSHRSDAKPHTLSGGEMQRAAIARALICEPELVLADEPTGNLDSRNADQILQLLANLSRDHGTSLVLVTHSREAAAIAGREIEMRDGHIVRDEMRVSA